MKKTLIIISAILVCYGFFGKSIKSLEISLEEKMQIKKTVEAQTKTDTEGVLSLIGRIQAHTKHSQGGPFYSLLSIKERATIKNTQPYL